MTHGNTDGICWFCYQYGIHFTKDATYVMCILTWDHSSIQVAHGSFSWSIKHIMHETEQIMIKNGGIYNNNALFLCLKTYRSLKLWTFVTMPASSHVPLWYNSIIIWLYSKSMCDATSINISRGIGGIYIAEESFGLSMFEMSWST